MQRARTGDLAMEPGEEDSATFYRDLAARREADASTRTPVLVLDDDRGVSDLPVDRGEARSTRSAGVQSSAPRRACTM